MKKIIVLLLTVTLVALLSVALLVGCDKEDVKGNSQLSEITSRDGQNNSTEAEVLPSQQIYYDDRVLVVLENQASIDSLSMDSLIEMDWGADVAAVQPRYLYRDEVAKEHLDADGSNSPYLNGYNRSLYLIFAQPNGTLIEDFIVSLSSRSDVVNAEKVPIITSCAIPLDDPRRELSEELRQYTLYDEFIDNIVFVKLTTQASRAYTAGEGIDWGFDYESVKVRGVDEKKINNDNYHVSFSFTLGIHDKQYILDLVDTLSQQSFVYYARPEVYYVAASYLQANDYYYTTDVYYGLPKQKDICEIVGLPDAWDITIGSCSVTIGIMDHLVDGSHDDLSWNYSYGEDFFSSVSHDKHGTIVAGIAGAVGNNTIGVAGVCWCVSLVSLHVFDLDSSNNTCCTESAIVDAFDYARTHSINIVVCSFGVDESEDIYEAISAYPGLVVCAAGNANMDLTTVGYDVYPAEYDLDNIIVVGATDMVGTGRWVNGSDGSNYSDIVDIFAPGECVWSTTDDTVPINGIDTHVDYFPYDGTSVAAPMVAGVAALMLSLKPNMTAAMLKDALLEYADPLVWSGIGNVKRLNAYASVNHIYSHSHVMGYADHGDGTHRYQCSICGYFTQSASHTPNYTDLSDGTHRVECSICDLDKIEPHDKTVIHTAGTHIESCPDCGYTATNSNSVYYVLNANGHTHKCSQCDFSQAATSSDFGPYTYSNASTHQRICSVCGYREITSHVGNFTSNGSSTHGGICTLCDVYVSMPHQMEGVDQGNGTHKLICSVCSWSDNVALSHSLTVYQKIGDSYHPSDTYHRKCCSSCTYYEYEMHIWVQQGPITYRCSLCGQLSIGLPIVHDGIEPPEGLDRGGNSEPFLYDGHWYVYIDGKLYILVELSDQKEP